MKPLIVFIHGLNTFADGLVHVGPATFGPMKAHWEQKMRAHGFDFVGVRHIGYGKIAEQGDRAEKWLADEGVLDGKRELVLLGHSLGGLVARELVTRPASAKQTKSIITFGSPHKGAHVSEVALTFDERAPLLNKVFKTVGYDVMAKRDAFSNFKTSVLEEFDRTHPIPAGVRCHSLLCEVRGLEISWPLVPVYAKLRAIEKDPIGDGFILSRSQRWGDVHGPYAVDHFAEMGVYFHLSPKNRARARKEFDRMTDQAAKLALEATDS